MSKQQVAFMSYVRFDDIHENERLTEFRKRLSAEVKMQTGEDFPIFQDRDDIKWGQNWKERLEKSLNEVTFLIPFITPSFFKSKHCREELERFIEREKELNRNDLILPVYYVGTPLLDDEAKRATDKLAQIIHNHNYADWRELRFKPFTSPRIKKELAKLATQIRDALERAIELGNEDAKKELENTHTNSIGMKFVLIPAGEFMMGSEEYDWEKPVHRVKISKPFYLGIYPATQREWKEIMGNNPSYFKGDDLPVENISWNDAQEFIKKLNEKEGTNKYRLPSEAEWEYAARAGTTTRYFFGDDESKLGNYAWSVENSGSRPPKKGNYFGYDEDDWYGTKWNGKTHPVGQKKPNPWGLYDMYGNVWEWVQDIYHDNYNGAPADGSTWEGDGSIRVDRGGSWHDFASICRSAVRGDGTPDARSGGLGFRLLRNL